MENLATNLKNMLPGQQQQEPSMTDEVCAICPTLTYTQRLYGFIGCFSIGYLLSFIGTLSLISATPKGIKQFAAMYVLGNVVALCATGFLVGPKNQCKRMFDKDRRISAIMYILMLMVVFGTAISGQNVFLVLFLLLIQVIFAVWYTISYIPFGRRAVVGALQGTCFKSCPNSLNVLV